MLLNNCDEVSWWLRKQETVDYVRKFKRNPNYLQSVELDTDKLYISHDLNEIMDRSDIFILAVPSAFIYKTFEGKTFKNIEKKIGISAVKGIVPEYHSIPARYIHKQFDIPYENIGIICGPCHAEEVALERLSYLTVACQNEANAKFVAEKLKCRYINTIISDDLFGTEISAVLKNVYSIASGIYHGLGYGDNFQAVLISNAIREIEAFVDAVNPIHRDVKSSAYLGDLLVTAYSQFSRNRTFGSMIGKGYSVRSAQVEMKMIAEGYYAVKSIVEMNKKFNVNMPISDAVYRVLYENMSPMIEMKLLSDQLN
jgi:glycerol-3-phosphate dehydrogenase (NAD(P)+)